eukprot:SAG31_NODE_4135_length_3550_cov_2.327731_4_plen_113_part_00
MVGEVTGDGRVVVIDSNASEDAPLYGQQQATNSLVFERRNAKHSFIMILGIFCAERVPVDLELAKVLGELPRKTFSDSRPPLAPSAFPSVQTTVPLALDRILRLMQARCVDG